MGNRWKSVEWDFYSLTELKDEIPKFHSSKLADLFVSHQFFFHKDDEYDNSNNI